MSIWSRINPFKQKNKNKEENIIEETNTPEQNNYEKEIEELKKQYTNLKNENNQLKKENTRILNSIDERIENKLKEKESENNHLTVMETSPQKQHQSPEDVDLSGLYKPLPEKYHTFNLINLNKTGFAWVSKSKTNNTYMYNRQKEGVQNAFRAKSIEKLYQRVTQYNQPWGIVDYEKASNITDIPEEILTKYYTKKETKNNEITFNEYWQQLIKKQYRRPFKYLHLKDGVLYNKSVVAYLQIKQIRYIYDNLEKFEKEKYTIKKIFKELQTEKDYNYGAFVQWMYNIVCGKLNIYLTENTTVTKCLSKEEYFYKLFKKSYSKKLKENDYTLHEGIFKAKGRKLNIPKNTVDHLTDNFDKYRTKDYDFTKIYDEIKNDIYKTNTDFTMKRDGIKLKILLYNIFTGYFTQKIENNNKDSTMLSEKHKTNYTNYHNIGIGLINQKLFDFPFILKGNEAVADYKGIDLYFVMEDIITLKSNIELFKTRSYRVDEIRQELQSSIEYANSDMQRLIYNIYENPTIFDDLITEYNDYKNYLEDNHIYSTDGRVLIIDDEDTGLTLANCNNLINDYINADNKQICLHNLVRLNEEINPRFICLIFKMYSENMFMNLIKQDKPRVVKINNPQKRRENNLY